MRVQPIDSMLSSSSSGNASIAQFSLDVKVLQVRELPQKQTVVFFIFLVLEDAICQFYGSFKAPSPQHCVGQLVDRGWGSGVTFNPFPWVLVPGLWHSDASFPCAHRHGACSVGYELCALVLPPQWRCPWTAGDVAHVHGFSSWSGRADNWGAAHSLADPRYSLIGLCFPQKSLLRVELLSD